MQSHSTFPAGVRARIARCPMPNAGVVSMVLSPVARRRNLLLCACRSPSSVVQDWPEAGTNCRSSVQLRHAQGRASEGGYCVPQAVQMKAGMRAGYTRVAVDDHFLLVNPVNGGEMSAAGSKGEILAPSKLSLLCPRKRKSESY